MVNFLVLWKFVFFLCVVIKMKIPTLKLALRDKWQCGHNGNFRLYPTATTGSNDKTNQINHNYQRKFHWRSTVGSEGNCNFYVIFSRERIFHNFPLFLFVVTAMTHTKISFFAKHLDDFTRKISFFSSRCVLVVIRRESVFRSFRWKSVKEKSSLVYFCVEKLNGKKKSTEVAYLFLLSLKEKWRKRSLFFRHIQ